MKTINNKFLVFAFMTLIALSLFFDSGIMMVGGLNGRVNENGWMGINSWLWFLTLATIEFGVALSWQHFKKKIKSG
ncbi:MAG: hypothetical protein WAM24_12655 [Ignavibacteriaceae bacterium]